MCARNRLTVTPAVLGMLSVLLVFSAATHGADPARRVKSTWPPSGTSLRAPITRDTWFGTLGDEKYGNNGGASRLKLKGQQEYSILDIDSDALKGKLVTGAMLHFHCATPDAPMKRMTVSSLASQWVEGTGSGYQAQPGSSCFAQAELGKRDWTYSDPDSFRKELKGVPKSISRRMQRGSTFMDAAFGRGHTIWKFAEATPPDANGFQSVAVSPDVVAARVAGLSYGFALCDDVGSVWSYRNGKFEYHHFPNRFMHSHEQSNAKPYLEIWTDGTDNQPPGRITDLTVETDQFPAGQVLVKWKTPPDTGGGKTLGFNVTYSVADAKPAAMPRYLIPMAGPVGQEVRMHIQDLPLQAGESVKLTIAAVDSAGNVGPAVSKTITVSANPPVLKIARTELRPFEPSGKLPKVGTLKVAIVDLLDKISPTTGKMIPNRPPGYKGGNHLWSAANKLIRLHSARNEAVCFQVNLQGAARKTAIDLAFGDRLLKTKLYRFDYVQTKSGVLPDVLVEQTGSFAVPFKGDPQAAAAKNVSLLCEVYVPHDASAGPKQGTLTIVAGGQSLKIDVDLTVWDFTLPDKLSFVPEMNAYGTAGPTGRGLEYYRLAHEHRLCLNRLYYGWSGKANGPEWTGKSFKWSPWAKQFAPLFTGRAFKDLPRAGEPVDVFYLPFNENWPVNVFKHYRKSYWADEAFTKQYPDELKTAFAKFAKYCDRQKWHDTVFEFYLNNKVYYKEKPNVGWSGSSALWIFDEPVSIQDFWALRWYGILFHQAVGPVKGDAKMFYRADVSRSDFGRNCFWGIMDLECFGGSNEHKVRMKNNEQVLSSRNYFTEYGSANDPADPNTQPVVWSLTAWSRGAVGVLPWQTIATPSAWNKATNTDLFYANDDGVFASVRVKAFRRGQQDVEYLTLLGDTYGAPHYAVAAGMKQMVDLTGKVHKTSEADAGTIKFDKADPTALWAMRTSVGAMVSAKKPPYKRCVRPMPSPQIDLSNLPDIGYVLVAPEVPSAKPDMD